MILDHIGYAVTNFPRARSFYTQALEPLGIVVVMEGDGWAMFGRNGKPQFWVGAYGKSPESRLHIAFAADNREQVRAFHAAALAAGGSDNGAPGIRAQYHKDYYGAFVIDPEGHNIEAVCHKPEP